MARRIVVNPDEDVCYCTFFIPKLRPEDIKFLNGRVAVSCADAVAKGDSIVASGGAISVILNASVGKPGETVFKVTPSENTRRVSDSDPEWYAQKVYPLNGEADPIGNARSMLESIAQQLGVACDLLK